MSIFASPFQSFDAMTPIIYSTFKSSSIKERSFTFFISLLCSIAAQKSFGAAFLKFNKKVWSSHSYIKFLSTFSGGNGVLPGIPADLIN